MMRGSDTPPGCGEPPRFASFALCKSIKTSPEQIMLPRSDDFWDFVLEFLSDLGSDTPPGCGEPPRFASFALCKSIKTSPEQIMLPRSDDFWDFVLEFLS